MSGFFRHALIGMGILAVTITGISVAQPTMEVEKASAPVYVNEFKLVSTTEVKYSVDLDNVLGIYKLEADIREEKLIAAKEEMERQLKLQEQARAEEQKAKESSKKVTASTKTVTAPAKTAVVEVKTDTQPQSITVQEAKTEAAPAPVEETKTEAAPTPAATPNRITFLGKTVSFSETGYKSVQSYIDAHPNRVGTFSLTASFNTEDGKPTSFAGHNFGAFKGLWNIKKGAVIKISDSNGTVHKYIVSEITVCDKLGVELSTGKNRRAEISGAGSYKNGGEYIILQTCKDDTSNYIVKAWPAK